MLESIVSRSEEDAAQVHAAVGLHAARLAIALRPATSPKATESEATIGTVASPDPVDVAVEAPARRRRWGGWLAGAAAALLVVAVSIWWHRRPPPAPIAPAVTEPAPDAERDQPPTLAPPAPRTVAVDVPTLTVLPAQAPKHPIALWALGLLAALVAVVLGRRLREDFAPSPPRQFPAEPADPLVPIPPPSRDPLLLDEADQNTLTWGAGQHQSDEPTPLLDAEATVRATTENAGIPALRFRHSRYDRGFWLWLDVTSHDPDLRRLADEIQQTLGRAGLPVERAWFDGVPDQLYDEQERPIHKSEVEARRRGVRVAIFTDGAQLADRARHPVHEVDTLNLLRDLADWERLLFVDFSAEARGTSGQARGPLPRLWTRLHKEGHRGADIPVVAPASAVAALCGGAREQEVASLLIDDLELWEAYCAVSPWPLAEQVAYGIRERLHLRVASWWIAAVRSRAGGADPLSFDGIERASLLRWLEASRGYGGPDPEGALVHREAPIGVVLGLLRGVLAEVEEAAARREGASWEGSTKRAHLEVDRLVLDLWDQPSTAAERLRALYPSWLGERIRRELAPCTDARRTLDADVNGTAFHLPWHRRQVDDTTWKWLVDMGFGADAGVTVKSELDPPSRRYAAIGLAAGVAIAALGLGAAKEIAAREVARATGCPPLPAARSGESAGRNWEEVREIGDGTCGVIAFSRTAEFRVDVSGGRVLRHDDLESRPCEEVGSPPTRMRRLRCTSSGKLARSPGSRPSRVLLNEDSIDTAARSFAQALLDSGTADVVLIAPLDRIDFAVLPSDERVGDGTVQFIILDRSMDSWSTMQAALSFAGEKPASEVWRRATRLKWAGRFIVTGLLHESPPDLLALDLSDPSPPPPDLATPHDMRRPRRDLAHEIPPPPPEPRDLSEPNLPDLSHAPDLSRAPDLMPPPPCAAQVAMEWSTVRSDDYTIGSGAEDTKNEADDDEKPPWIVRLPGFQIGTYEVTNYQYKACNPDHAQDDDRPVAKVDWNEARAFCASIGAQLPSEWQWEAAARGKDKRRYPWGSVYSESMNVIRVGKEHTYPVHDRTDDIGPFGTRHQGGNVLEWTDTCYQETVYKDLAPGPRSPPPNSDEKCGRRVVRGGSFWSFPRNLRAASRNWLEPEDRNDDLGFRCARSIPRQPG